MREWTREERYRELRDPEEIRELHERNAASVYRQSYHVQPVTGLSSDPNGFTRYRGVWHLFYQWCPWGAVHGLKYWYHVTSRDLLSWENAGVGLYPDRDFDNRGVHSGSAITAADRLYLFYTGNHRDENWVRTPYTCAAVLGADGKPEKLAAPLFGPRPDYSEHQRDPKIVWNAEKGRYYIFIGAQTADLRGCVLIYTAKEPLGDWSFAGQLNVPGYEAFGGMWECPCITRLGGKDVLIFSPQYTKLPGRGESTNHNVCLVGSMDYDTLTFTPEGDYRHLDYGFDFYAAQFASGVEEENKAVLIAWIGLPDNHYPTEEEDWEGSMTLPRALRLKDGKLLQSPAADLERLRERALAKDEPLPAACELAVDLPEGNFELALFTRADGSGGLRLTYDAAKKTCTVDRRGMEKRFNEKVGEVLDVPFDAAPRKLRVFIDRSSTELFFGEGEATFTTHSYPTETERGVTASDGVTVRGWALKPSVRDDFVI